jgi:hypothetical protein
VSQRQTGKRKRFKHRQHLGHDQYAVAVETIDPDTGKWSEEEDWYLSAEADQAEQEGRVSQPIHEPTGGDSGHPGANERNPLTTKEEPVVAMPKGTKNDLPADSASSSIHRSFRHAGCDYWIRNCELVSPSVLRLTQSETPRQAQVTPTPTDSDGAVELQSTSLNSFNL